MSLVCEEVLLVNLELFPTIARTALGRPLQMQWVSKNDQNATFDVVSNQGNIDWTSSNTAVATVDQTGLVTPLTAGVTEISSTFMGITQTRAVTVKPTPATLRLCGGAVDNTGSNSYSDCLKVASLPSGGHITGPFSDIVVDLLGLSKDPTGASPYSYQRIIRDGVFVADESLSPFAAFQYGTDGARFGDWCRILSDINFQGRNNWQPATKAQLAELYTTHAGPTGLGGVGGLGWVTRNGKIASNEVNEAQKTLSAMVNFRSVSKPNPDPVWINVRFDQSVYVSCYAPGS